MTPKIHDRGDNKIPSNISSPDKNGHSLKRRIDTPCINESEGINNNFRSEILLSFLLFLCVTFAKNVLNFLFSRLY